jgi:hypothetical protein
MKKKNKAEVKFEIQIRYFPKEEDFISSKRILYYISLTKKGKRFFERLRRGI